MSRQVHKRPKRVICVGDLDRRVILSERKITEPGFGETDFGEDFPDSREVWAQVATFAGRVLFNGVDTDTLISHEVSIRYSDSVTSETWVQLKDERGTRLDVVKVENLDERNEFMLLLCKSRGYAEASKV